jgi:hypothetical protein
MDSVKSAFSIPEWGIKKLSEGMADMIRIASQ